MYMHDPITDFSIQAYMYVTFKFYAGIYMAQGLQCGFKVEV